MPWLWEAAIAKYGSVCDEMKKNRENTKSPFSSAIRIDERTSSGRSGLGATLGISGRVVWATTMVNKAFTASLRFTPLSTISLPMIFAAPSIFSTVFFCCGKQGIVQHSSLLQHSFGDGTVIQKMVQLTDILLWYSFPVKVVQLPTPLRGAHDPRR